MFFFSLSLIGLPMIPWPCTVDIFMRSRDICSTFHCSFWLLKCREWWKNCFCTVQYRLQWIWVYWWGIKQIIESDSGWLPQLGLICRCFCVHIQHSKPSFLLCRAFHDCLSHWGSLEKRWSEGKEVTTSRQGCLIFPSEGLMVGLLKRWGCRKNEARAKDESEAFSKTMEGPRKASVFRAACPLNRKIWRGQQSLASFIEFEKLQASLLPHLFCLLLSPSCETVGPLSSINLS